MHIPLANSPQRPSGAGDVHGASDLIVSPNFPPFFFFFLNNLLRSCYFQPPVSGPWQQRPHGAFQVVTTSPLVSERTGGWMKRESSRGHLQGLFLFPGNIRVSRIWSQSRDHELDAYLPRSGAEPRTLLPDFTAVEQAAAWTGWFLK